MRQYIFIILSFFCISVYSQEAGNSESDTIRKQGYFIIETNDLNTSSDIPFKFLFIPMEGVDSNLETSYFKNSQSIHKDLFIPTPYIINGNELTGVNSFIKKFTNTKSNIKLNQELVSIDDLLTKTSKSFKFKGDLVKSSKSFKVIYLDGIWIKIKIPKKNSSLFLEEYNRIRLDKKVNECYEYYFLIETKAISYDVLFRDSSIEIIYK
jgi:hypothetical protein